MKLSLEIEYVKDDKVIMKIEEKAGEYVVAKMDAEFEDTNLGEAEDFVLQRIRRFFNKIY